MISNISHIVYIIISPIGSTISIILNILTIYVFCKKFRMTTVSMIIIVNISACDIFVCLFSNTFYMVTLMHPTYSWSMGSASCKIFKFLTMMTNVAQIYLLSFLTADRLRRLIYPTAKQWLKQHGIWLTMASWIGAMILTSPRLVLFDEQEKKIFSPESNRTIVVNYACKAVGMDKDAYAAITIVTFLLAYMIPCIFVVYAAVRTQLFMWKRRNTIHISNTSNFVTKMKNKLSLTFNLTAVIFILIWTPFFLLSVMDLTMNLIGKQEYVHMNFTLRCSLLILGGFKPVMYLICLEKFRKCFLSFSNQNETKIAVFETSSPQAPSNSPLNGTMETNTHDSPKFETNHFPIIKEMSV